MSIPSLLRYLVFGALLVVSPRLAEASPAVTPFKANGFFQARQVTGCWHFIDPNGTPFISMGVTSVRLNADFVHGGEVCPYRDNVLAKYGNVDGWRQATVKSLFGWGFNTLGARSDDDLATIDVNGTHLCYTPVADFGAGFIQQNRAGAGVAEGWMKGIFADVFDPAFETFAQKRAADVCAPHKDDPQLLGWFTDNEMRWGPDWRGPEELLVVFLNQAVHTPGRDVALNLLRQRYPDVAKFNAVWGTSFPTWEEGWHAAKFATPAGADRRNLYIQDGEVDRSVSSDSGRAFIADCDAFLALLADRYFRITSEAIRKVDPNHLVIGCRFAYLPAPPVVAAAGKYLDVISLNCYTSDPSAILATYAQQNKPLLIGEYGFRAKDSGLPNLRGAGPIFETEAERATAFETYARLALGNPNLVGMQWFKHVDEPKEGRFDGENSNCGIVRIDDQPYELLLKKMTEINKQALILHKESLPK